MEHVYKTIEITGSSEKNIEDAVEKALLRVGATVRGMRWFEVIDTRGYIENEKVSYWQVTLKIGFNVDAKE
jgi:hypothetical protein